MPEVDLIIVFPTTHLTLQAEKSLEEAGVEHRTVMKPRKISSDCGLAIRIHPRFHDTSRETLVSHRNVPASFYKEIDGRWECIEQLQKS